MCITLEELNKVLQHKNIHSIKKHNSSKSFDRIRCFEIDKKYYEIEWYCNQSYLKHENMIVSFKYVDQVVMWPNCDKVYLQFYALNRIVCCTIEIEDIQENKKE